MARDDVSLDKSRVVFNLAGSLSSTATLLYYYIKRSTSDPFVQKNDEALFNRFSCLCQSLGLASHRYVSKGVSSITRYLF